MFQIPFVSSAMQNVNDTKGAKVSHEKGIKLKVGCKLMVG